MMQHADKLDRKVCIGVIAGPHGVNGQVRLKSFTADPKDVVAYGPLTDAAGMRQFAVEITGSARNLLVARIDNVRNRNAAEALRGIELYVDRAALPDVDEDEFYHADLIGLPVRKTDGSAFGSVLALFDYGAGDMIEIRCVDGGSELFPFNREVVPEIDLKNGFIVIEPPAETYVRPDEANADEASREAGQ